MNKCVYLNRREQPNRWKCQEILSIRIATLIDLLYSTPYGVSIHVLFVQSNYYILYAADAAIASRMEITLEWAIQLAHTRSPLRTGTPGGDLPLFPLTLITGLFWI